MGSILDEIRGAASVHTHGVSRCAATEAHRRGIDRLSAKTLSLDFAHDVVTCGTA
jgi:hypothetical protein